MHHNEMPIHCFFLCYHLACTFLLYFYWPTVPTVCTCLSPLSLMVIQRWLLLWVIKGLHGSGAVKDEKFVQNWHKYIWINRPFK